VGSRHGRQTWEAEAAAAVDADKGSGDGTGRQTGTAETARGSNRGGRHPRQQTWAADIDGRRGKQRRHLGPRSTQ